MSLLVGLGGDGDRRGLQPLGQRGQFFALSLPGLLESVLFPVHTADIDRCDGDGETASQEIVPGVARLHVHDFADGPEPFHVLCQQNPHSF